MIREMFYKTNISDRDKTAHSGVRSGGKVEAATVHQTKPDSRGFLNQSTLSVVCATVKHAECPF